MGDLQWVYHFGINTSHSSQLSLTIPLWVGAITIGNALGHRWERGSMSRLL